MFSGLFSRTAWVSWYQKGKTSLGFSEARGDTFWRSSGIRREMVESSGISWAIRKQSAPRCRQITTPTPHHSIFTGQVLFLTPNQQCQNTEENALNVSIIHIIKCCATTKVQLLTYCQLCLLLYLLDGVGSTAMTRASFTAAWTSLVMSSLSLLDRR